MDAKGMIAFAAKYETLTAAERIAIRQCLDANLPLLSCTTAASGWAKIRGVVPEIDKAVADQFFAWDHVTPE